MSERTTRSKTAQSLRRRAEESLRTSKEALAAMPAKEVTKLVQELQIHQIELQMQNDELRRTQLELGASRDNYIGLYDFAPVGYLTLNRMGIVLEANLTSAAMLGIERGELIHKKLSHLVPLVDRHDLYQHLQDVFSMSGRQTCALQLGRSDGTAMHVWIETIAAEDEGGVKTRCRMTLSDITAQKQAESESRQLEARVHHAQRLESLGILAGGIAHDFNNLLTAILGHVGLALLDTEPGSPISESLDAIQTAGRRAAELTSQMLTFTGNAGAVKRPLDVGDLISEITILLKTSISKEATLTCRLAKNLPAVEGDPSQLRQVVLNLLLNASEAIHNGSGTIRASTDVINVDRNHREVSYLGEDVPTGSYVVLEVDDTGCGMGEETKARIFDPFFTTKFTGRGLGLSAVLGIVRSHNGAIQVTSNPGKGTTVRVLLPSSSRIAESPSAEPDAEVAWLGSGTILVVDDEAPVRMVAQAMLERSGVTVLTAGGGLEAVALFREHCDEIAAVVLDLTMPIMDGEKALNELRRIRPNVRVILCSGFSEQEAVRRFEGKGLAAFLRKPYQAANLLEKLRNILAPP